MGTYLEDYLESMYMLPSEVKRNFDLMRELDKNSHQLIESLRSTHKDFLRSARKSVNDRCMDSSRPEPDESELRELVDANEHVQLLTDTRERVVQKLDEKIAIAAQSYDIVDHHIRRLDEDLEEYAKLLKPAGELDDDVRGPLHKKRRTSGTPSSLSAQTPTPSRAQSSSASGPSSREERRGRGKNATVGSTKASSNRKRSAAEALPETPAATPGMVGEDLPIDPNEPIYCFCRRVSYGQMVGCDNDDCKYEWFHFDCVGLKDQPQGTWYCNECKEQLGITA